jgi:formamidopyrimidine-DNA glycosylase
MIIQAMPELPEVEVTRLSFADRIAGARIVSARVGKPLRWPLGCEPDQLVGRVVRGVRRRGKYLLLDLDDGLLLVHLGMSGSLSFAPAHPPAGPHDHFDLTTSRGVLRLHDPRRFGAVVHASADSPERWHYVRDVLAAQRSLDAASAQWPEVRYVAGGHVHEQNLFYRGVGNALMAFLPWPGAAIRLTACRPR